jgi:hypothetical protein
MCESRREIYYDPHMQCLWSESWGRLVPIEEVGVGRVNDYGVKFSKV